MEATMTFSNAVRALAVSASALCLAGSAERILASGPMTVVYVGADDCQPCKVWQRGDGEVFRHSAPYQHLVYREVRSPRLFDLMDDEYWPDDLRGLRSELGKGTGVPLWIVTSDRGTVVRAQGLTEWRTKVLPALH